VAEIGVHRPETCSVYDYIEDDIPCTLVEPEPRSVDALRSHFRDRPNVTLHPVAVHDRVGDLEMVRRVASTFVADESGAPAIVNDGYQIREADRFAVPARTFDLIDDGTIDLLSVDIEGSEWYVLKHMVSSPGVISLETHGALYTNPHLDKILAWMKANDYCVWYRGRTDTVFVRRGEFRVNLRERIVLRLVDVRIASRRFRKRLARRITRQFG
jgi:FkbM family methyltransferase